MDTSIDLRQLRYFLAVSETLHVGRAAERLHMSQPPLSRQIHLLEAQLGVPLFERSRSGVTLSAAGAAFVPAVRRVLAQADAAIATARAAAGTARQERFAVGYTTVVDGSAIPDVLGALVQRFPRLATLTRGMHSISLVRALRQGALDAAFIGLHTEAPGLTVEVVHEAPLVVALPAAHRLARKRAIGFDDLRDEPLFWFERRLNPGYYDHCAALFQRIGFAPTTIAEPADHHVLLGLIAQGQGVALIPASLARLRYPGVVVRPFKAGQQAPTMGIGVAYLASKRSPVLAAFLELVRAASRA